MSRRALTLAAALLWAPLAARAAPPATLRVAAASNLKAAVDALVPAFEAANPGVRVKVTLGASGAFVAQLRNGAPFDVFLSGDRDYPRKVVAAGLAERELVYAVGSLVVWAPPGTPVDLERRGLAALADPAIRKVAIANPAVAPYGRAAEAALRAAGLLDAVRRKLVLGGNVSQAAQFARSGAADAAIVPLSLALAPELAGGRTFRIPPDAHPPLEQSAVALRAAADPALASRFLAFLGSENGRAILAQSGYALP